MRFKNCPFLVSLCEREFSGERSCCGKKFPPSRGRLKTHNTPFGPCKASLNLKNRGNYPLIKTGEGLRYKKELYSYGSYRTKFILCVISMTSLELFLLIPRLNVHRFKTDCTGREILVLMKYLDAE